MKTHINKRTLAWVLAVIMASLSAFTSFAGVADDAIVEADESSALPYYAREWNSSDEIKLGGKNVHSADMFGEDPEDHYSDLMVDDADNGLLKMNFDPEAFDYRKNKTYVEMIMEVTRITKLNPFVTAAMIIQEQGVNPSDNPLTTGAGLPDGRYTGVYNLLNVNAYAADGMGAQERGLWWAGGEDIEKTSYGRPNG